MYQAFLIKYAEIGIKGKNRYKFEDALMKHIRHALKDVDGEFAVTKEATPRPKVSLIWTRRWRP